MPGRGLHVAQRHSGVEGGHDERGTQHVRVNVSEPGALADRPDPVRRAPVESLPVPAPQDRTFMAFADSQVDRARCARHERDHGRLGALAGDPKDPIAALDGQVLDVGLARLADPQPIHC